MPKMTIHKLNALPEIREANALYVIPDPLDTNNAVLIWVDNTGESFRATTSMIDIHEAIADESVNFVLKQNVMSATSAMTQDVGITPSGALMTLPPAITTQVLTYSLPNVGDTCLVSLDDRIGLHYVKTTNGGYEGYKVTLVAIGADRLISFRRDTTYDNTSSEGVNNNNLLLVLGTPYESDALAYGSMREFTRKVIVDRETLISWQIDIFGFGTGMLRFIVERQQPNTPQ